MLCEPIIYENSYFYLTDVIWEWTAVGWKLKYLSSPEKWSKSFLNGPMLSMARHDESYTPPPPYYALQTWLWTGVWCLYDTQTNY